MPGVPRVSTPALRGSIPSTGTPAESPPPKPPRRPSRRPVGDRDPHRRQAVPDGAAEPAGAVGLDAGDDLAGRGVRVSAPPGAEEADQHLVEDDLVEDLDPGLAPQPVREAPGQRAAALDEVADAGAPEGTQGGVEGEAAGPARELGDVVEGVPLRAAGLHQIGGGDRHRLAVGLGIPDDHDPRVVGDVEPLVAVGGPGVGPTGAADEGGERRARGGPQPEGAVDVEPAAPLADQGADLLQRIEGPRVHVPRLGGDDQRAGAAGEHLAQRGRLASSPARPSPPASPARGRGRASARRRGWWRGPRPRSPRRSPARRRGRAPPRSSPAGRARRGGRRRGR